MSDDQLNQDNDISFEADDEFKESEKSEATDKLAILRKELKTCREEKAEYLAGWQRAKADYLNLKRNVEEERKNSLQYAKADVLNDLIRLADSFEMAFADKNVWESVPINWRQGIEYIHSQLLVVFKDHGLEELNPIGQVYDPTTAETAGMIDTDDKDKDQIILEVLKKGYQLGDKVVRPAQVKIGHYKQ